jgi:hypothetical protein
LSWPKAQETHANDVLDAFIVVFVPALDMTIDQKTSVRTQKIFNPPSTP